MKWKNIEIKKRKKNPNNPTSPKLFVVDRNIYFLNKIPYPKIDIIENDIYKQKDNINYIIIILRMIKKYKKIFFF